jgi:hypothetical protein
LQVVPCWPWMLQSSCLAPPAPSQAGMMQWQHG